MYRLAFAAAVALTLTGAPAIAADVPDYVKAAVADKDRPKEDTDRDVNRHPAEIMAMTGVKAGDRAVDVGPGKGYYARILARIVGKDGKVYLFNPDWIPKEKVEPGVAAFIASGYPNAEGSIQPMAEIKFDKPVDLVFMSQLYHDQVWKKVDIAKMNKTIFDALKPGGVFFIIDHVGPGVTTPEQIDKLHRIDPAEVKKQVLAAGFVLDAESDILKNAADPHTAGVFDPSIRGKTDQFVFKFKKPAK